MIIDSCVNLLFLIDIIITFRSSYLDPNDWVEITEPIRIAKNYTSKLIGGFVIDFISSVPLKDIAVPAITESLFVASALDLFGLLKIFRIFKLGSFI